MINVNQITSQLAKMPDPMLQKFAAMHKNDPYTVSLALSESNRRKEMRASAQAQMGGQQQPKVVDQEVAQMLPEDVGIGQLPAQNLQKMAGGGIVAFEEGGEVDRYQNKGLTESGMNPFANVPRDIAEMVLAAAAKYKIDPNIAMRLVKQESGFDPTAESKRGAVGLTQLMPDASKEMGLPPEERTNPAKNLDAGFGYLRKQLNKYGDDYSKALSAFNWGGGNVDKHIKKNEGSFTRVGLPKETADYLTKILPMGSAGAGELPKESAGAKAVATKAVDKGPIAGETLSPDGKYYMDSRGIPTRSVGTASGQSPAPKKEDVSFMGPEWFMEKAEGLGMSRDTGRNVYNTLMAPTPLLPASTLPKTQGLLSRATEGLAGLGEKIYNKVVPSSKLSEEGIAALQAEKAAANAAQTTRAAQEAGATLEEQAYLRQMEEARRAAQAPSAAEKIQNASLAREAGEAQAMQNAAKTAQNYQVGTQAATGVEAGLDALDTGAASKKAPEATAIDKDAIQALQDKFAKEGEATAAKGGKGGIGDLFNDPMFIMGMQLMANQNPHFFGGVGEAGMGTAKYMGELRKAEAERGYYGAKGAEAQATADYLNRGAKDRNMALEAEKLIQNHMNKWSSSQAGQLAALKGDNAAMMEEDRVRKAIYQQLGISPTMVTGGGMPNLGAADAALINKYLKK